MTSTADGAKNVNASYPATFNPAHLHAWLDAFQHTKRQVRDQFTPAKNPKIKKTCYFIGRLATFYQLPLTTRLFLPLNSGYFK